METASQRGLADGGGQGEVTNVIEGQTGLPVNGTIQKCCWL